MSSKIATKGKGTKGTKGTKAIQKGGLKITGGKYPLVFFNDISVPQRDDNQLFFNPRFEESFNPVKLADLELKIRIDSLQAPLVARAIGDPIDQIQLIAGERRYRCLKNIIENNLPCYNKEGHLPKKIAVGTIVIYRNVFGKVLSNKSGTAEIQVFDCNVLTKECRKVPVSDLLPTISGRKLYHQVSCTVYHNCSDEKALGLAFSENEQHESLRVCEEISLVERLLNRNLKQGEVADILGTNPTWVSQTLNFRHDLPKPAFEKLMDGTMARNVAVAIMGYKPEDRDLLFRQTVVAERQETSSQLEKIGNELIQQEDAEEIALSMQQQAEKNGDAKTVAVARKKATAAKRKQQKAQSKLDKVKSESGVITQSHVEKGATKAGVLPKKSKMLTKDQIKEFYVDGMNEMLDSEDDDYDSILLIRNTAKAILRGERDPLKILHAPEQHDDFDNDDSDNKKPKRSAADFDDEYDEYEDYEEEAMVEDALNGMGVGCDDMDFN